MKRYHVFTVRMWLDAQRGVQKKLQNDFGQHGLLEMYMAAYHVSREDSAVVFDRGGEVAVQVLPSDRYPEAPYKAVRHVEGIGFGFDYIDLLGNYRAADGSLVFNGPPDPQQVKRSDGTIAFSGPRNPDS
jgi:hypothetical protein